MRCRSCPPLPEEVRRTADLLERRWTVSILYAAHSGAVRFNEFAQSVGRIPPTTLAARLAELEAAGILERRVVDEPTRPASTVVSASMLPPVAPRPVSMSAATSVAAFRARVVTVQSHCGS